MLASVGEQAGLSLTWSETPEDMFSHHEAQVFQIHYKGQLIKVIWPPSVEYAFSHPPDANTLNNLFKALGRGQKLHLDLTPVQN